MLNVMRRSANSFIIKTLLIILALSFMVWGVGNYVNNKNQLPVVEADAWTIGTQEFSQAYEQEFSRMRERFGGSLDKKTAEMLGLKMRTLNSLINRYLILTAAADLHLTVSPEVLRQRIAATPAFQDNGKFDKERYSQLLHNNRMTPLEFEKQLTSDIVSEQIRRTVGTLTALPKALTEDIYQLDHEKRIAETFSLQPKDLEETIQASEEELAAYLSKNNLNFMTLAKVKIRFALLNPDSVRDAVTVSEEEIKNYYQENSKNYTKAETRKARHILAQINDKTDAATATQKIQQAQNRLKAGETFETVAKALSDDSSAPQGGDLGEFGRGVMVPPFEEVAFSLEEGKISEPVTTEYGIHLIYVEKIHPAQSKPLESVTTEIKGLIIEDKAKDLVYDRSTTFEDQLFSSGNLQTIAKDLNLRYKETDFFTRDDPALSGVEREPKFLEAAFSTPKGTLSPLVELPNNQFAALEVVDRQEPAPKTLEQAHKEVLQAYKAEKANEEAKKIMTTALKLLTEGKTSEEIKTTHAKIQVATTAPFTQDNSEKEPGQKTKDSSEKEPGQKTKDTIFKLELNKPNHPEIIEEEGRLLVARLTKIIDAPAEGFKDVEKELSKKLEESLGEEQLLAYLNGLWKLANIRIHQDVLDRL